jgi:hypothetical protein
VPRRQVERQLHDRAGAQHGLITRRQALAAGLSSRQIELRLGRPEWQAVLQGVYRLPGHPGGWPASAMAACLAGGALVLPAHLVDAWVPLLTRGQRLGVCGVILGHYAIAPRQLILTADGVLYAEGEGITGEPLTPCLLPDEILEELVVTESEEPASEDADLLENEWGVLQNDDNKGEESLDPATVRVCLFGTLRVTTARGEAVAQPGRGRKATRDGLAYLAAHPGWHDSKEMRDALTNGDELRSSAQELHTAMSEARRWLLAAWAASPEAPPPPKGTELVLQRPGQGYRLATELVDVDLAEFEQAWATAKSQPSAVPALRQVLTTYTGTFLDPAQNAEAIAWVEQENLRSAQQVRVAWAAMTLAEELCRTGSRTRPWPRWSPSWPRSSTKTCGSARCAAVAIRSPMASTTGRVPSTSTPGTRAC